MRLLSRHSMFVRAVLLATCFFLVWLGLRRIVCDQLLGKLKIVINGEMRRPLHWLQGTPALTRCHNWKNGEVTLIPVDRACPCLPANHIYFLKTHKCGSTTFASLFVRFAYKYHLSFGQRPGESDLIPWLGWPNSLQPKRVVPTYVKNLTRDIELESLRNANSSLIDIITLHTVYNKTTLGKIMPNDTVKVAIIREPFSHFQSTFDYGDFDFAKSLRINGSNPMKTYLESPTLKEKRLYGKHIQNFISTEFGFLNHSENNPVVVKEFIAYIDKNFRLVATTEYFSESIVLLKRMLCWRTEDIVFLHLNKNPNKMHQVKPDLAKNFTYLKSLHRRWSAADYLFYDHFNQTFWRKIEEEGKEFYEELKDFERILSQVETFCQDGQVPFQDRLLIPKSKWHSAFNVTLKQCDQMQAGIYKNVKQFFAKGP